ncbi:MAG: DinB family protein [Bryobacterales bacterium]|nr:DinB family protein [Bryobacterales bacterium]
MIRPEGTEYAPYFDRYVSLAPAGDLLATLAAQPVAALLEGVSEERGEYRYDAGKWSVKEALGHIIDTERIMAYRALRVARNDATELPGSSKIRMWSLAVLGRGVWWIWWGVPGGAGGDAVFAASLPEEAWGRWGRHPAMR